MLRLKLASPGLLFGVRNGRRKIVWVAAIIGGVVLIYAAIGFLLLPPIAEHQIEQRLGDRLERAVRVADIDFNPFTFRATVEEVRVEEPDGTPLINIDAVRANFDPIPSLSESRWQFGELVITRPWVRVVREDDGSFNISKLLQTPQRDKALPPALVEHLVVAGGVIELVDRSLAEEWSRSVSPLELEVHDLSTAEGATGNFALHALIDGSERLRASGSIGLEPRVSHGTISLENVSVVEYLPLLPGELGTLIESATLSSNAAYAAELQEPFALRVTEGELRVEQMVVTAPGDAEPLVSMPLLQVDLGTASWPEALVRVDRVLVERPKLRLQREQSGATNVERLLAALPQPAAASEANDRSDLELVINEIVLHEGWLQAEDHVPPQAAQVTLTPIEIRLENVGTNLAQPINVDLEMALAETEGVRLSAEGALQVSPLQGRLQLEGVRFPLERLLPYVQRHVALASLTGTVSWRGLAAVEAPAGDEWQGHWRGSFAVEDLSTRDGQQEVLAWKRLLIEEVNLGVQPGRVVVEQIALDEPVLNLVIDEDGTLNLAALFPDSAAQSPNTAAAQPSPEAAPGASGGSNPLQLEVPMEIRINEILLQSGRVPLRDESLNTPFNAELTAVRGAVDGLSTAPGAEARLALAASFNGESPIAVEGSIHPRAENLLAQLELSLDLTNLSLNPFEPYVERFVGFEVQQGEMRADFTYDISRGQIDGMNRVLLDDFFLGERVEGTPVIDAPVKFGLAVLRDRQNQIELNLPVSGSLTSPDFSIGAVVRRAMGNALKRVATAPFAALGRALGLTGGEAMANVRFEAGRAELGEPALQQLAQVATILQARPSLSLLVRWRPDPELDGAALRQARLRQLEQQARERVARQQDNADEADALRSLYAERFPEELPDDPEADPRDPQRGSWLSRALGSIFGRGAEEPEAAAPETGPSMEEMRERLLATISVDEAEIAALAGRRAQAVREQLLAAGVPAEQVRVAEEPGAPATAPTPAEQGQVYLALQERGVTQEVDRLATE